MCQRAEGFIKGAYKKRRKSPYMLILTLNLPPLGESHIRLHNNLCDIME